MDKKEDNNQEDKQILQQAHDDEELDYLDENSLDIGEILSSWEIPEATEFKKSKKWYLYFIIIIIALLIYSYFSRNPLFAVIIVFFTIIYWLLEKKETTTLLFAIAEDGITIGQKFIEYKKIRNFYIIYQPPKIKNLYFDTTNPITPVVNIPILNQNPVEIRKILLQYLDEDIEKEEIPTSESIGNILKL